MRSLAAIANGQRLRRWPVLAVAGTVLAAWVAVAEVVPRYAGLVGRWQAWRGQRAKVASAVTWEVEQTSLEARRLYLEQYFASLYVSLPKSDQMSVILQALQRYASAGEVRLEQVGQEERVAHETFDELPVSVALQGTFHGIGAFVDQVERSRYLMKVAGVDVEADPLPYPVLHARLQLRVIILKEKSER